MEGFLSNLKCCKHKYDYVVGEDQGGLTTSQINTMGTAGFPGRECSDFNQGNDGEDRNYANNLGGGMELICELQGFSWSMCKVQTNVPVQGEDKIMCSDVV